VNHPPPELLENVEPAQLTLQERPDEILTAIARKRSKPSRAILEELAELNIALDDLPETNNDSFYLLHNHDQPGDIPEPQMIPAEGVT
jgi:hypothetical protein